MSPKVSIVVPVYNVAPFIERCARSLFEQTLYDIEIIFVDDCSPDNSVELIQKLLEQYPQRQSQVRFVHNSPNRGVPYTRHAGVMAAKGEYVLQVDGDDYVSLNMAEAMYQMAVKTQSDIVVCDYCFDYEGRVAPGDMIVEAEEGADFRDVTLNRELKMYLFIRLMKRELIQDPTLVWPKCHMHEDVVLVTQVTLNAQKVTYLPQKLVYYCFNGGSISHRRGPAEAINRFSQSVTNLDLLHSIMAERGLSERYRRGILSDQRDALSLLENYLYNREARKLWLSTYPDCHRQMFYGTPENPTTLTEKVKYVVKAMGWFALKRKIRRK